MCVPCLIPCHPVVSRPIGKTNHCTTTQCFGYNKHGELGLGDTANRGDGSGGMGDDLGNVDLGTGAEATAVSAGWQHTCALLEGGSVKCWGETETDDGDAALCLFSVSLLNVPSFWHNTQHTQ